MIPDRVDFSDTDRLDEFVAQTERRVPRHYGAPAPVTIQRHRRMIRFWAWCRAARVLAKDFWDEFIAYVKSP